MLEDKKLSENFTLFELTHTNASQYQSRNRELNPNQIIKLEAVSQLLEQVRIELGVPLTVNSGYRCKELNDVIGSTDRSQHLLCEAVDFVPMGLEIGNAFRILWSMVRENKLKVGQLIFETAPRAYGTTSWLHISLGEPYRIPEKCQQVLRMLDGVYTLLRKDTPKDTPTI